LFFPSHCIHGHYIVTIVRSINHGNWYGEFTAFQNEERIGWLTASQLLTWKTIPMNDALNSNWNFPNMPDDICIPCGNAGNGIINEAIAVIWII